MRDKQTKRIRRHKRIRKKILGTQECPRLCIYRGLANVHCQLIDDINQHTLLSVSSAGKDFKKKLAYGGNIQAAKLIGQILAEQAKQKGISRVIFDRAGFSYHGRIKASAESCREHGLQF